jgi:hypothetical protein
MYGPIDRTLRGLPLARRTEVARAPLIRLGQQEESRFLQVQLSNLEYHCMIGGGC